jgi:hypothetical protein
LFGGEWQRFLVGSDTVPEVFNNPDPFFDWQFLQFWVHDATPIALTSQNRHEECRIILRPMPENLSIANAICYASIYYFVVTQSLARKFHHIHHQLIFPAEFAVFRNDVGAPLKMSSSPRK